MIEDRTVFQVPHRTIRDRAGRIRKDWLDDPALEDPRSSVEMWDDRFALPVRLYFEHAGDDPPLVGVEIGSESHPITPLDPSQLTHLAKNLPLYVAYARAELKWWDAPDTDSLLETLNEVGVTRRGKPGRFFRVIADEYGKRVAAGDSAPVTSIAEAHGVVKSTASRWLKEARRRGYIAEADNG